ncbi:MAG TPA: histidine phosphatase family protein [Thermomicrobiales bacterium]|nr:histidine phosphatase family protein [Thermomicrobiales bacterium]
MRMLLIRHGQSLGNIEGRIQDGTDPLTERGRAQARAVAAALAARGDLTHLYASPLARARETAEIIGAATGVAPVPVDGLAEIDAGIAAGQLWVDWSAANPELAAAMGRDEFLGGGWPGGENGVTFSGRVLDAFQRIATDHLATDDVVAVVAHGGSLAWIAAHLHGDPLDRWPNRHATLANCSVSEVVVGPDGALAFASWNEIAHLAALDAAEG